MLTDCSYDGGYMVFEYRYPLWFDDLINPIAAVDAKKQAKTQTQ